MTRSLSFTYLFIILAVSYLGGTLLFRELPEASVEKILILFDARVVSGSDAKLLLPVTATLLFFVLAFAFSRFKYSRFLVIFTGAIKCVLFGVSSAYLLAKGLKILEYAMWWFPFQLLICFALLLFCAVLTPPFFLKTTGRRERNNRGLITVAICAVLLIVLEYTIFFLFIK
ncbi:hypothetical protein [Sporosarcina pasteurii]|uniref:Stage II sporulation protein M n=1 Tax=Sporosarcina pasteurii TaxID=1474 RepID=A0A380BJA1_SPOPA|nr:hypothetical protein [Sporosarcina pasteurii]MDS9470773.1 hypothetical protein [Sporosarcina pasteurii]QBQ05557.1 hypothetical protein E2C16_07690 [Sporosarcina pasteurii]SUJ02240.1 Uncharacterised protein [Sporosarcina pasteurii]